MQQFLSALLPVFVVVSCGWFLARREFVPAEAWGYLEKFAYLVFIPALIVGKLAKADFTSALWALMGTVIAAQFVLGALGLLARHGKDVPEFGRAAKGSIIQSNVRWNIFVAVAIVEPLYGLHGMVMLAIAAAALIPTANVLSILALTHYSDREEVRITAGLWFRMLKNPLVLSCVAGAAIGGLHLPEGNPLDRTVGILGNASVALGLLTVGAGLNLSYLRRSGLRTALWSAIRLVGMPLVALGVGLALGLAESQLAIAVIAASTPTAPSGYILARQLGGNATFSANLIAVQSLISLVTMPLVFAIAMLVAG